MGINLKDAAKQKPINSLLPEGRYHLKINKADLTVSSTNKQMIKVEFNVIKPEELNKRKVWTQFVLEGKALGFLYTFLEEVQSPILENTDKEVEESDIADSIVGLEVTAEVTKKTPQSGSNRTSMNEVRNYKKVNGAIIGLTEEYTSSKNNQNPPKTTTKSSMFG